MDDVARPFTLAAWAMLTAGIVLGGWWAYMELGWGGYWAWDPVENASLIPWLIATAALHTMLIQTRRNKLHGVNVFLMALTTISAFFATYLVRSGVVQSVHAFGSGGVGVPLLLFILISVALSFWIALLARRSDTGELAGIESREGFLILTSWAPAGAFADHPYRPPCGPCSAPSGKRPSWASPATSSSTRPGMTTAARWA